MSDTDYPSQLQSAALDDPLYYLRNMDTVVAWVSSHHGDLLTADENRRLTGFLALPEAARALLTRLIMRSGELFRSDRLHYPELPEPEHVALSALVREGWLDAEPELSLDDLFRLFTLPELRPAFADRVAEAGGSPARVSKRQLRELVAGASVESGPVEQWLGDGAGQVVRVRDMALFDRVRLMFFGNLRQSWTDFVLVELGLQRFESVPFTPDSRAFHQRADVDTYLLMHRCREQLDEGGSPAEVWQQVPDPTENPWLGSRRDRLLLELGRQAERAGDRELALQALAASGHREARLKHLRLLERMKRHDTAWDMATAWQQGELSDAEVQGLHRILKRLAPKVGEPRPALAELPAIRERTLILPSRAPMPVELVVQSHLHTEQAPVFYVENTLINGLFGLLCWPVIFEPVPGAFFHPFHTGPVDLTREDFVSRRRAGFERCFEQLHDGRYRQVILDRFHVKQELANPFVAWPVLSEALLALAMDCIPSAHLEAMFRRLLDNIREHRSGFPDLIRFEPGAPDPASRYEMIEVKGPGDRLQDHQRRWLHFFARHGMPASVCYLRWQEDIV